MNRGEVIREIETREEGDSVAFAVDDQDRYKLQFSYEVDGIENDGTVNVRGPSEGQWRFLIEDRRPLLQFRSPSNGWQNAGVLDYVEGR